jgi:hypothetical protein
MFLEKIFFVLVLGIKPRALYIMLGKNSTTELLENTETTWDNPE